MKAYTFQGSIIEGIALVQDEKFGPVVFLGETGRGRRYEKVALSRKNPPEIHDNKVFAAEPVKITVPARDNKSEQTFWVLAKPQKADEGSVLVRIDTEGTYTRDTTGRWTTVKGNPETVVAGYGAYGDAGRIGSWNDGLVIMYPGDVLRVKRSGGYKNRPDALFLDAQGELTSMDFEEWEALNAIEIFEGEKSESDEKSEDILFGAMPAFSFTVDTKWKLERGIKTTTIGTGRGFKLGPTEDGWRAFSRMTVMVAKELSEIVVEAAVAKADDNLILITSDNVEPGKFLVHIDTQELRKGGYTTASVVRGEPKLLAKATMDHGMENPIHHDDMLWVLGNGDVLRIGQSRDEYSSDHALFVENGELKHDQYFAWELRDAKRDPAPYIAKGMVPVEHIPANWRGKVVEKQKNDHENDGWSTTYLVESLNPLVLDAGWNDNPPVRRIFPVTDSTAWLKLCPSLKPEEKWVEIGKETVTRVATQPAAAGYRKVARVITTGTDYAWTGGPEILTYELTVEVPAEVVEITHFKKGDQTMDDEKITGHITVMKTYTYKGGIKTQRSGKFELYGEFEVEIVAHKGGWWWLIHDQEIPDEELTAIQGQLEMMKAAIKRLWSIIVFEGPREQCFSFSGEEYCIGRHPNCPNDPETANLYRSLVFQGDKVNLAEAFRSGLLHAWVKSLGHNVEPWVYKTVAESKKVAAVKSDEPKVDLTIYMGKSASRDPSHVWVIDQDGDIIAERSGDGNVELHVLESALVIRWQTSNYGYAYTEEWEVHYVPSELTDAQCDRVARIEVDCHKHFIGQGTGWAPKLGIVRFEQSNRNLSEDQHKKLLECYPINVKEWGKYKAVKQQPDLVDPTHPIVRWIEVETK